MHHLTPPCRPSHFLPSLSYFFPSPSTAPIAVPFSPSLWTPPPPLSSLGGQTVHCSGPTRAPPRSSPRCSNQLPVVRCSSSIDPAVQCALMYPSCRARALDQVLILPTQFFSCSILPVLFQLSPHWTMCKEHFVSPAHQPQAMSTAGISGLRCLPFL